MKTYIVDTRGNDKGFMAVEADSHYEAAKKAAARLWPRYRAVITVNRETGDGNGSGMFQAYTPLGQARSSIGQLMHVCEE